MDNPTLSNGELDILLLLVWVVWAFDETLGWCTVLGSTAMRIREEDEHRWLLVIHINRKEKFLISLKWAKKNRFNYGHKKINWDNEVLIRTASTQTCSSEDGISCLTQRPVTTILLILILEIELLLQLHQTVELSKFLEVYFESLLDFNLFIFLVTQMWT